MRAVHRVQLRENLSEILNRAQRVSTTLTAPNIKHLIVENARKEMFGVYDNMLADLCQEYVSMKDKQSFIRDVWKITMRFLFQLDRLDVHNGCYVNDIDFPSVA